MMYGEKWSVPIFMICNFGIIFSFLTISIFQFVYFFFGIFIIVVITLHIFWTAATYYIDHFSKNYLKQFENWEVSQFQILV